MESTQYPERHWTYDDQGESTQMPSFMNDGYAPPDWDLITSLEAIDESPLLPPLLRS